LSWLARPAREERNQGITNDETARGNAPSSGSAETIWQAFAGCDREGETADRRRSFDRKAERHTSGHDLEAWRDVANGVFVGRLAFDFEFAAAGGLLDSHAVGIL
jgi:hypothetical protein